MANSNCSQKIKVSRYFSVKKCLDVNICIWFSNPKLIVEGKVPLNHRKHAFEIKFITDRDKTWEKIQICI